MPGASTSAALNRAVHRYRSAPFGARVFVHGRAFLSDLTFVERFVPKEGFIVDLGCGHGLFPCLLREASEQRRVLGIDLDERKIEVARGAVRDTQWLRFEVGDIIKDQPPHCDAVTIVDVLYLLPFEDQERVLKNAAAALGEGGPLIVKAQERRTDPRYAITYAQELVTVGLGFTRGGHERFYFPSREEALGMFERTGFVVEVEEMPRRPYTDVVYLARKAPFKAVLRRIISPLNDASADLRLVADEIRACTACPLHRSARQAVPGDGSADSGILFLGEAPGYHEDLQGKPFVGAAGQFLDELLAGIGLDRRTVFITNVVRHRPPENRDPLPEEILACHMWLLRHLEVLQPRVIVTLGRHAMGKFFPGESISRIHGKPRKTADGLVIFPVYHPAAALHQPALRSALHADFAALALFLATTPPTKQPEERPVEQITLFG